MSQRDRDARAAMREILRAGLQLAKVADCASLAEMAWSVTDAMAAERAKRTEAEAAAGPCDPAPGNVCACDKCLKEVTHAPRDAAVAAARREGRDAGLREVREALRQEAVNPADADDYEGLMAGVVLIDGLLRTSPSPAPDVASLHAELAKLRAVAEAAARLQRWRHSDQVSYAEGEQSDDALMATLDAALPNWRSAP